MSTSKTWPGGSVSSAAATYTIPASGELSWSALADFLNALGDSAQATTLQKFAVRTALTTPVTVAAATDCAVICKLTSPAAVAVNLPAGANKQVFFITDGTADAATNNITINRAGSDTINGATTLVLSRNSEAVCLIFDSSVTDWKIVARSNNGLTNPMATTGDMVYGGSGGASTNLATGSTTGLLHGGNAAVPSWSLVVNADVSGSAAIAGSKLVAAASGVAGAVSTGTQTFTGAKTFETQLIGKGTATNDTASAGYIGEYSEAIRSSALNVTTTQSNHIVDVDPNATISGTSTISATGLVLAAGCYDVTGAVVFNGNSATTTSLLGAWFGTATGDSATGRDLVRNTSYSSFTAATFSNPIVLTIPTYRVNTTGTTLYLKAVMTGAATGSIDLTGFIRAVRVR